VHRNAALLLLLALVSCNQQKRRRIGIVPKATSHVFWVAVEKGAKAAGKDLNVDIEWSGAPSETDYGRQIQIVDSMINRRVDGLAIAASERKALVATVDRAMKQGIPVTIFDSGIEGENYSSYVATNNFEGGQLAGRALAKLIGSKGNVGLIMHAPGSASTMDRERGFTDVIEREFPNIKIAIRLIRSLQSPRRSREHAHRASRLERLLRPLRTLHHWRIPRRQSARRLGQS